mgnify:CR=1 FL=1
MSKAANHKKLRRPKWVPKWLNAPLVIFVVFVVGLVFFNGGNNYIKISEYNRQINILKAETKTRQPCMRKKSKSSTPTAPPSKK